MFQILFFWSFLKIEWGKCMKKITFSFLSIVALVILSACDTKQYYYSGKSENWLFQVNTTGLKNENYTDWEIQYIGNDSFPEVFNYEIHDLSFSQKEPSKATAVQLDENGLYKQEFTNLCKQCRATKEQQQFEVLIVWENQSEILNVTFDKTLN